MHAPYTTPGPSQDSIGRAIQNDSRSAGRASQRGMTLLELIIACGIMLILATAAMPLARFTVMRQKESELRRSLREMRDAIDRYKDASDRNLIRVAAGTEGYPPDLETLVNGVEIVAQASGGQGLTAAPQGSGVASATGTSPLDSTGAGGDAIHHVRFLRRIPQDPMTGRAEWGLRAVQDDPDSGSWGGKNVFDVYSMSQGIALDGTRYSEW
jgi:general secretion pathway protein G